MWLAYESITPAEGFHYLAKRWVTVLPGPETILLPQVCFQCMPMSGHHEKCMSGWYLELDERYVGNLYLSPRKPAVPSLRFTCTCPDPSHKDKP